MSDPDGIGTGDGERVPESTRNEISGGFIAGNVIQAGYVATLIQRVPGPVPVATPRQLPPMPRGFVNRTGELSRLHNFLDADDNSDAPLVVVVSGLGGVGKSAITRRWAHQVSGRFADGQLYADLGAHRHDGGVEVSGVLGGFLRSLGVHEEWIPAGLAERTALFRSRTVDLKLLVLVDDALHAAEVVPLLPPSAGSTVVVTSRRRLNRLVVEGARSLTVPPLTPDESRRLLADMIGEARVSAEPEAAAELARLCAGLPIALRVAGARLLQHSRWSLSKLVAELTDDRHRLDRLATEGELVVEAVFDAVYRGLPPQVAWLYRLLGSLPLSDVSAQLVEAVIDGEAGPLLDTLVEASLIEELDADRYRMHDLVKLHAARRAEQEEPPSSLESALGAAASWYSRAVSAADVAIMGDRLRLASLQTWDEAPFTTPGEALDWLDAERGNLLPLLRTITAAGWHEMVWAMTEALWALYHHRKYHAEWLEASNLGAEAARSLAHHAAEARMRNQSARAYIELGDFGSAERELSAALSAADESGDARLRGIVLESSGQADLAKGDADAAVEWFTRARDTYAAIGRRRGVGLQTYHLGQAHAHADRYQQAAEEFEQALSIMTEIGDELTQAKIAIELSAVYRVQGRVTDATALAERGLAVMRDRRMVAKQARAWRILAGLAADTGDRTRERACLEQALSLYIASGNQRAADAVRASMSS